MTNQAPQPLTAAARLRAALEEMTASLARPNLESLLIVESALTGAIAALPSIRLLDAAGRQSAREDLAAAQVALGRCRRLGTSLSDFVRMSLDARGQGIGYESSRGAAATLSGRGLETRA